MRTIHTDAIITAVAQGCIDANYNLNSDILYAIHDAMETEQSPIGKQILHALQENAQIARERQMPICQDTGMAVVWVRIGQDVHIEGIPLGEAINKGVRHGYMEGCLRKSVVGDPLERVNTGDNTPAVIHYELVEGDGLTITIAPKGFGSENMSALGMLKPSDGVEGVVDFVLSVVLAGGSNPCPPVVVGVGIGGTMEKAALLAKKALMRPIDIRHESAYYAELEERLLGEINALGIGPQGLGGTVTALGVNIETFATHIAGLPVAVNMNCHATRHIEINF